MLDANLNLTFNMDVFVMGFSVKKDDLTDLSHAEKNILIQLLQEEILLLKEQNKKLEKRVKDLEARLNKNSSNSSKPPSSDIKKPLKTTSLRKKSNKPPGGQRGHNGKTLKIKKNPNKIIRIVVDNCVKCGKSLKNSKPTIERRQEFEIPEPKIIVTEYQSESRDCKCGYTTSACFPKGITNPTQYGIRAKSLMVYMNQYQLLPYKRAKQFFSTIYDQDISTGTIVNAVNSLSGRLDKVEIQIKDLLSKGSLANCDETSMNVNGNKKWLHTVGTEKLVHYEIHDKRGKTATEDIGILPKFKGIMVHDHWKSYFFYQNGKHALCNAHHLRELKFLYENYNMNWAFQMSELLLEINNKKEQYIKQGKKNLSRWLIKKYNAEYDKILLRSRKEQSRKGIKDSKNLLQRLRSYKEETLLFMNCFSVPFTNNLSERDLRMSKVKQKISGCFRNPIGGKNFCRIRTLLGSASKNNINIFKTIQKSFRQIISVDAILAT